jgi:DNA gyrase subunit A
MAGVTLADSARVVAFAAASGEAWQVVTISASSEALAGVDAGRAKVSELSVFPPKGRATSGVRCHGFTKGEDHLVHAGVFDAPRALTQAGKPVELPSDLSKRDASGSRLEQPVGWLGSAVLA